MNKRFRTILIIDKSNGGSFILQSLLEKQSYNVHKVTSFLKAIDFAHFNPTVPALVIVDTNEANSLFYDFPNKFISRSKHNIPIIVHSAITNQNEISNALSSGYADFIIKPLDPSTLEEKITKLIKPINLYEPSNSNVIDPIAISESATAVIKLKLSSITEYGIECLSNVSLEENQAIDVISNLFSKLGLTSIKLKVIETTKIEAKDNIKPEFTYNLSTAFVDIAPEAFEKLRTYCLANSKQKQSIKAA